MEKLTSNKAHTPGPWELSDGDIYARDGDKLTWIASMETLDSSLPWDEMDANARLIAKAPEMMAILKDMGSWAKRANERLRAYGALDFDLTQELKGIAGRIGDVTGQ